MSKKYTIGLDYGTDSVRSLIVDTSTGEEIAGAVFEYPRWKKGLYCDPGKNQFRQHPLDYLEGLEYTVKEALRQAPPGVAEQVAGISVDTTGSTPVAVDERGTPLALTDGFRENPNAMFILWKDHTAVQEAAEINSLARKWDTDFTQYEGGYILRNGSGRRSFTFCARTLPFCGVLTAGWSIVTGFPPF